MTKKQHERMARSLNKELAIIQREVETIHKKMDAIDEKMDNRCPRRYTDKEIEMCDALETKAELYDEIGESLYKAIETLEHLIWSMNLYSEEKSKEEEK